MKALTVISFSVNLGKYSCLKILERTFWTFSKVRPSINFSGLLADEFTPCDMAMCIVLHSTPIKFNSQEYNLTIYCSLKTRTKDQKKYCTSWQTSCLNAQGKMLWLVTGKSVGKLMIINTGPLLLVYVWAACKEKVHGESNDRFWRLHFVMVHWQIQWRVTGVATISKGSGEATGTSVPCAFKCQAELSKMGQALQ